MRKFLTDIFSEQESNVIVFGVPLGKFGKNELNSLREASWFVETYDIDRKINLLENVKVFDSGDLKLKSLKEITQMTKEIIENKKIPLMLGGNHLSTFYSFQAFAEDTKLIVFDAHCDLKSKYIDEKVREAGILNKKCIIDENLNSATWLRRLCEIINPKNVMIIGIRSADEDEIIFAKENGILFYTSEDVKNSIEEVKLILNQFTKLSKVYVSLDIDVFDPSIAPAVLYPEPNGIFFAHFKELIDSINGKIVGIDVCCIRPIKDSQVTEFLAIKSIFEILKKI
jgi:agmatinase